MVRGLVLSSCLIVGSVRGSTSDSKFVGYACQEENLDSFAFCDTSLNIEARIDDLISRIDLGKAGPQLTARESVAYPELGVPDFYWGTNALHSIREYFCYDGRCPTAFPIPASFGASFNMSLAEDMARAFGYELRAAFNTNRSANDFTNLKHRVGLATWSPTINIVRDPRWGRNVEVPSEDPYLTGQYAKAYTVGVQSGPSKKYPMAAVTLKHWLAYSLEKYDGASRHTYDAEVSAYDLASTYMPGFEPAVKEGKALGVMCSYNEVNGAPTCGNPELTKILREDWGFDGYISSDTDACEDIYKTHHYSPDVEHAVAACLKGGTDINSGNTYKNHLEASLESGLTSNEDVLAALRNSFRVRFRLGLFDPKEKDENKEIGWEVVGRDEHKASSLLAAKQGMTLLKNDGDLLPFSPAKSLAVIGTDVDKLAHTIGNYQADNICLPGNVYSENVRTNCLTSIWDELRNTTVAMGGTATLVTEDSGKWTTAAIENAVAAAKASEQVLLFISNYNTEGGEGRDVTTFELEATQHALVDAVLKEVPQVVLVLINGGVIGWDTVLAQAPAVLEAWQPGPYGGVAVAETVFGRNNPGGKLPMTMYYSNFSQQSDFKNMSLQYGPGRTYRYLDPTFPVAYRFGHGLSYTTFELQGDVSAVTFTKATGTATVKLLVRNTGASSGDEVLQVYVRPPRALTTLEPEAPIVQKQLIAFQRVTVKAGEQRDVEFDIKAADFGLAGVDGDVKLHAGDYTIVCSRGHGKDIEVPVKVEVSEPVLLKKFRKFWQDATESATIVA